MQPSLDIDIDIFNLAALTTISSLHTSFSKYNAENWQRVLCETTGWLDVNVYETVAMTNLFLTLFLKTFYVINCLLYIRNEFFSMQVVFHCWSRIIISLQMILLLIHPRMLSACLWEKYCVDFFLTFWSSVTETKTCYLEGTPAFIHLVSISTLYFAFGFHLAGFNPLSN